MTFDPEGRVPGLAPKVRLEDKVLNMKCRNLKCNSITAVEIVIQGGGGQRVYKCTECGHPVVVNVGGDAGF